MTDPHKPLRDALEAGPTPGPWRADGVAYSSYQVWGAGRLGKHGERICMTTAAVAIDAPPDVRDANAAYISAANPAAIAALLADHDRLAAEVEALRVDAERYRWLRNEAWAGYNQGRGLPHVFTEDGAGNRRTMLAEAALDAAIDSARKGNE